MPENVPLFLSLGPYTSTKTLVRPISSRAEPEGEAPVRLATWAMELLVPCSTAPEAEGEM